MDYGIALQEIIDELKADKQTHPLWRNKLVARLTELQPWCLMLYDTPSFDTVPALPNQNPYDPPTVAGPVNIPPALQEFADPGRIKSGPVGGPIPDVIRPGIKPEHTP